MTRTITLDRPPNLGALMAGATATAMGRGGELPDVQVIRTGVRVDRGHLAAYDRMCGFGLRDTLPAAYIHVLTFGLQLTLMAEREYPLPLPGVVHVANRLMLRRRVDAAESLDFSVHAEGLRPHPKGRQVDLVGTASVAGEQVWQGRSTYLAKGPGGAAAAGHAGTAVAFPRAAAPQARWQVAADLGRRYAAVSGDVNPIHLSALTAKAFGFPRAIAHGMWSMARCLASLESWAPQVAITEVEFRRPVLLPSTVELRTRPAGGGYDLQLSSSSAEHLRGTIRPLAT